MHKVIHFRSVLRSIIQPDFILCVCGALSLIAGTLLTANADASILSLMRLATTSRVSIVCFLALQLLPFLFVAYAAYISRTCFIYAVCSCKLFFFAYFGSLIRLSFGSAGWLVRGLFQFPDLILVPLLCWFSVRNIASGETLRKRELPICIGIVAATALINCFLISPFLTKIIDI